MNRKPLSWMASKLAAALWPMALTSAPAQTAVEAWVQRYSHPADSSDVAQKVVTDNAGNVIVAGYADGGITGGDFLIIKYSGAGVPLWTNRYDGPGNGNDTANAMVVDGSGNVFVTGQSYGSGSSYDYATVAYSGAGMPLWTNRYNGTGNSEDYPNAVAVDGSGNVFVTGSSVGSGNSYDYATVAYSGAGVPLWTNRYNGPGNSEDHATALAVAGSGDVFATGHSASTNVVPYNYDYATIAYSGAGVPLWTNRYNGPGNRDDLASAVVVDGSGNVFVTGSSWSGITDDYATVAYSGAGVPLWTNRYNGTNANGSANNDGANAIAVDETGNVFVTGSSPESGIACVDFVCPSIYRYATIAYSGAGVPLWTNSGSGTAIAVDGSGNVFVTGSSVGSGNSYDYATVAYSGAGVPLWTNRYNGTRNLDAYATALAVDGSGNVFVTGYSASTKDVVPDTYYNYDYATIAYSGAGVPLWTNRYNGPGNYDSASAVAVDGSGNVFVTGSSGSIDCNILFCISIIDYATIAYSGAGVPLWTNHYNGPGNSEDYANSVAVDGSGNVFVTGSSWSGISGDYATVAYSGAGVPLWTNRYNGPGNGADIATAMAVDDRGNVFVTGSSATIAYSGLGVPLWTNIGSGVAIAVDGSGNVFVTGSSYDIGGYSDYATVAYSGAGVPLWTNRYNGPANGNDMPQTKSCLAIGPDGAVYVTGASDGNYTSGTTYDYATIKYIYSIPLHHQVVGNQLVLSWANAAFSLQSAPAVQGPYTTIPGAMSPYGTAFSDGRRFFRLKAD